MKLNSCRILLRHPPSILYQLTTCIIIAISVVFLLHLSKDKNTELPTRILTKNTEFMSDCFFYSAKHAPFAEMIDGNGKTIHNWGTHESKKSWHFATYLGGKNIAIVEKDKKVAILSAQSKALWELPGRYHHRILPIHDGNYLSLRRGPYKVRYKGETIAIVGEWIHVISSSGKLLSSHSLSDILFPFLEVQVIEKAKEYAKKIAFTNLKPDTPADVFHINSIDLISFPSDHQLHDAAIVLTISEANALVILDKTFKKVLLWRRISDEFIHAGIVSNNQNVVFFDNGRERKYSRAIEYSLLENRERWSCDNISGHSFFTEDRGSVIKIGLQRYLITVTQQGFASIVNEECKNLWTFMSKPNIKNLPSRQIYRMEHIPNCN